jgi:hypothetical protein
MTRTYFASLGEELSAPRDLREVSRPPTSFYGLAFLRPFSPSPRENRKSKEKKEDGLDQPPPVAATIRGPALLLCLTVLCPRVLVGLNGDLHLDIASQPQVQAYSTTVSIGDGEMR